MIERRNDGTRWVTVSADLMSENGSKFERTVRVKLQQHYDFGIGRWVVALEDLKRLCYDKFPWIMRKRDVRIMLNNIVNDTEYRNRGRACEEARPNGEYQAHQQARVHPTAYKRSHPYRGRADGCPYGRRRAAYSQAFPERGLV